MHNPIRNCDFSKLKQSRVAANSFRHLSTSRAICNFYLCRKLRVVENSFDSATIQNSENAKHNKTGFECGATPLVHLYLLGKHNLQSLQFSLLLLWWVNQTRTGISILPRISQKFTHFHVSDPPHDYDTFFADFRETSLITVTVDSWAQSSSEL